uniref:Putative ovule protein n=1 Tax=Solanum chacoense TaxID=4108 RepID=A0A0V0IJT8_SOLCH
MYEDEKCSSDKSNSFWLFFCFILIQTCYTNILRVTSGILILTTCHCLDMSWPGLVGNSSFLVFCL